MYHTTWVIFSFLCGLRWQNRRSIRTQVKTPSSKIPKHQIISICSLGGNMSTCDDVNFFSRHPEGKEFLLVSYSCECFWVPTDFLISSTCFVALDIIQYQPSFYMAWNGPTGKNKEFLIKCSIRFFSSQTHSPLYLINMDLGGGRELLYLQGHFCAIFNSMVPWVSIAEQHPLM